MAASRVVKRPAAFMRRRSCEGWMMSTAQQKTQWSQQMTDELRRLRDEGLTFALITMRLNEKFGTYLSRSAVVGKANRMGLSKPASIQRKKPVRRAKPRTTQKPRPAKPQVKKTAQARRSRKKATPKNLSEPSPDCAVAFAKTEHHHCRWPVGGTVGPDMLVCGARRDPESNLAFCPYHVRMARTQESATPTGRPKRKALTWPYS